MTRRERRTRTLAAAILCVVAVAAGRAAAPPSAFACTCMSIDQANPFTGEEGAVLVGRVGADDGTGVFAFTVERWFKGGAEPVVGLASGTRRHADGTWSMNTCGLALTPGQALILGAHREGAILSASSCSPHGDPSSGLGQALLAAARRTFGDGVAPGGTTAPPDNQGIDIAAIALGTVGGVLLLVFGLLAWTFLRNRADARSQGEDVRPPS